MSSAATNAEVFAGDNTQPQRAAATRARNGGKHDLAPQSHRKGHHREAAERAPWHSCEASRAAPVTDKTIPQPSATQTNASTPPKSAVASRYSPYEAKKPPAPLAVSTIPHQSATAAKTSADPAMP